MRARVTGIIQERFYQEGQNVKQGDLLFKIEPEPLQAALDECKAALDRAQAVLTDAQDKAKRYSALVSKGAVSGREHTQSVAEEARARAEYAAAKAALERARLDLEYTNVTAPISGRVRRALVTKGALVDQNGFTHLTTVEQIDPIYVRFSSPSSQRSRLRRPFFPVCGRKYRWKKSRSGCCSPTERNTRIRAISSSRTWRWTPARTPLK